jgi:hypothetical protein
VVKPTISINASIAANCGATSATFTVGTYTGSITTKTLNSGPGSTGIYTFTVQVYDAAVSSSSPATSSTITVTIV